MALPPTYVKGGGGRPANPKTGGHYVPHQGGWQLIHAVGPGHWVPGPVAMKPPRGAGPSNVNTGRFANPIFQPSKQLSGSDLYKAALGLVNAQTQGPLAEIAQQIASNNTRTGLAEKAVSGYFGNLGNLAKQGVTDEQGISSGLNAQLQGIGAQENTQLQGFGQQGQQALSQYAPGGTAQAAQGQLTADMAREQGLAAQDQGAFRASGATQGAIGQQLAASNLGSFAKSGQESIGKIGEAGQLANLPLTAKVAGLRAQKGALLSADEGKLRQQEIANRYTAQGLGLKGQQLQLTAAQDAARNALTAQGQKISAANNLANQQIRWAQLHEKTGNDAASQAARQAALNLGWYKAQHGGGAAPAGGGPRPLTTNENNAWFARLGEVEALVNRAHGNGTRDPNQIRQALESGKDTPHGTAYDPVLVETAFQLLGYGSINRSQAAILHNMGLRGGTFRGAPIKVTANYHRGSGSLFGQPLKIY